VRGQGQAGRSGAGAVAALTTLRRRDTSATLASGSHELIGVPAIFLGTAGASPKPVQFTDARLKVEINATDGDAG
jgi:hypothetical protein